MGDDDDRARLAGMTELEREEILADRRDARAKIQDRKRIIQMAREKKEREAGGKKKFKPSDVRKKTLEDAKGKSRAQALADIAKKKDASRRRAADREDDDDDDDEYGSDDDVSLEDEELTGILPQREKRAPRSRRAAGDPRKGLLGRGRRGGRRRPRPGVGDPDQVHRPHQGHAVAVDHRTFRRDVRAGLLRSHQRRREQAHGRE